MKSDSPLKDPKILKETLEVAEADYGKEKTKQLKEINDFMTKSYDYEVDIDEEIGMSKNSVNFDLFYNALSNTDHLPSFDLFDNDLGIDGDNYLAMKKWLYYYHNSIRQNIITYKINSRTRADNRSNGLIITEAGGGKTTIKNSIKRNMYNSNSLGIIDVTGVSHPEQLVGKIVYKGKGANKTAEEIKGIMGYKCVLNDESQDMLNEKNDIYAKSQRIKRLAMDPFGENKISKKLVADNPDDILEYYSPSNVCDFAHPKKLESPFFDTGSFRRYYAFNVSYDPLISLDDITEFSFDNKKFNHSWSEFLDKTYSKSINDIKFDEQTLKIISEFHRSLLLYLLKHKNPNAFRYGLLTRYALRVMFCKNVLILAALKKEKTPSIETTITACQDTLLFVFKTIETYNDLGNMGTTSDVWGGVCDEDAQALEHLYRQGALSEETSNISIDKFNTILANFHGCNVRQSRAKYYKLKKDGFVSSKQTGKTKTRVWLKHIPKEINIDMKDYNPLEYWKNVFKGVKGAKQKKAVLEPLKKLFTDDKIINKIKGYKGYALWGCMCLNNYTCVQVYIDKIKYNNNNNIGGG